MGQFQDKGNKIIGAALIALTSFALPSIPASAREEYGPKPTAKPEKTDQLDQLIKKSDDLYGQRKFSEAIQLLEPHLKDNQTNANLLKALVRAYHAEKSNHSPGSAEFGHLLAQADKVFALLKDTDKQKNAPPSKSLSDSNPVPKPSLYNGIVINPSLDSIGYRVAQKGSLKVHCSSYETDIATKALVKHVLELRESVRLALFPKIPAQYFDDIKIDMRFHPDKNSFLQHTGLDAPGLTKYDQSPEALKNGIKHFEMDLTLDHKFKIDIVRHELTHVLTNHMFVRETGKPFPRWCDEGLGVNSESTERIKIHLHKANEIINKGRQLTLGDLFAETNYPNDFDGKALFYGQSVAFTTYMIQTHGFEKTWQFAKTGETASYLKAATDLGYSSIDRLESAYNSFRLKLVASAK